MPLLQNVLLASACTCMLMPVCVLLLVIFIRWDASQVYGKDDNTASALRNKDGNCELALDKDGNMPLGKDGIPMAGPLGFTACCLL